MKYKYVLCMEHLRVLLEFWISLKVAVFLSIQQMKQSQTNRTFQRGKLKLQDVGLSIA